MGYGSVGGLNEQIRELREVRAQPVPCATCPFLLASLSQRSSAPFQVIELPLINPELFTRVGIKAPKGVLLYGPPGTGKTLLARAVANNIDASFLKVVASAIVDKYIGESARLIREVRRAPNALMLALRCLSLEQKGCPLMRHER